MSVRREHVHLSLADNFTGRLAVMAETARTLHARWELDRATWEPHDWRDFS